MKPSDEFCAPASPKTKREPANEHASKRRAPSPAAAMASCPQRTRRTTMEKSTCRPIPVATTRQRMALRSVEKNQHAATSRTRPRIPVNRPIDIFTPASQRPGSHPSEQNGVLSGDPGLAGARLVGRGFRTALIISYGGFFERRCAELLHDRDARARADAAGSGFHHGQQVSRTADSARGLHSHPVAENATHQHNVLDGRSTGSALWRDCKTSRGLHEVHPGDKGELAREDLFLVREQRGFEDGLEPCTARVAKAGERLHLRLNQLALAAL